MKSPSTVIISASVLAYSVTGYFSQLAYCADSAPLKATISEQVMAHAMEQGQAFYKQGNYQAAVKAFEQAIQENPRELNVVYYCALANHQCHNYSRAKQLYQYLVTSFPGTQQAKLAQTALTQLGVSNDTKMAGGKSSASDVPESEETKALKQMTGLRDVMAKIGRMQEPQRPKDFASLPDQGRINFERAGNHVQLNVEINGRTIPILFDTGAPITTMNQQAFEAIGGQMPTRRADGQLGGIGAGRFDAWTVPSTVKVGPITRVNFPLVISQSNAPSLLGQDFFSPFQFTIDDQSGTISFTKIGSGKSSAATGSASLSVPFRWSSRHMIVDALINGKPYPVIFDTGAHGVSFTKKTLKDLNMSIPADAVMGRSSGIGGVTTDWRFEVDSIALGPIVKKHIEVSVVEDALISEPLLGQTFFGDYQYTVDYEKKLIQFLKR